MELTTIPACGSVSFEARANLSRNYTERTVDPITGQPYFDVFDGSPPDLHHDWPDFGDLTARYWEAAIMIDNMTGQAPANTGRLRELLMSYFEADGLNYRPSFPYSYKSVEMFDQSRTLSALCSAYMAFRDEAIAERMKKIVDGISALTVTESGYRFVPGGHYISGKPSGTLATVGNAEDVSIAYFTGPLTRSLVKVWELIGYQPARDLAIDLTRFMVDKARAIGPNGELKEHIHSKLATAAGIFMCGKITGNQDWCEAARKAWKFCRKLSGPCGFVPEVLAKEHAIFRSETCTIMDYLDLTLLLAADGDDSMWGEAEKILRNHLIESQLTNCDWGTPGESRPTDDLSLTEQVGERMLGGFAGWSALDQLFAIAPQFRTDWLRGDVDPSHYVGKRRLFQNCCGPAGLRAIYLAWSTALVYKDDTLFVNMLVNRRIGAGGVSVREAESGNIRVEITADLDCALSVRIPAWTKPSDIAASRDFDTRQTRLNIANVAAGETIVLDFPYAITQERYTVYHQDGCGQEHFMISFKGDSAIKVEKVGGGLSDEQYAKVCGLKRNPRLYQRKAEDVYAPEPEPLSADARIQWHPGQ